MSRQAETDRECPSEEELLEVLGAAAPEAWSRLHAHLDVCDSCRLLVAQWAQEAGARAAPPGDAAGDDQPGAARDPFIGTLIGNYRISRLIGSGGMGAVYLLEHVRLPSTLAAIKLLKSARQDSPRRDDRFTQEAMVASAIGDDRVARPFDLGTLADGTPYIIMEYVAGHTVAEIIAREGPLPIAHALAIAWAVADTLVRAHARGILHRDIKPSNLMVAGALDKPQVKLLDFGVARATGALKLADTLESAVIGSPGYISPEAAMAAEVDSATDVYSLGATLFHMLTGKVPFPAASVREALQAALTRTPSLASAARPAQLAPVPQPLDALVARSMEKQAERRPSMAEFRDALGACSRAADHASSVGETGEPSPPRPVRGVAWALAAAALLGLAGGGMLIARARRAPTRAPSSQKQQAPSSPPAAEKSSPPAQTAPSSPAPESLSLPAEEKSPSQSEEKSPSLAGKSQPAREPPPRRASKRPPPPHAGEFHLEDPFAK
jgi:serine/threonine-protein kinase